MTHRKGAHPVRRGVVAAMWPSTLQQAAGNPVY